MRLTSLVAARRQIVLLFSLMKTGQPSVLIERNLDVLENATVKEIRLTEPGTGENLRIYTFNF